MRTQKTRWVLCVAILMFLCTLLLSACNEKGYSVGFLWKVKIEGEYKTEYLYGEDFVMPDFYVKDIVPFTKWKQADSSKLEIYGFDSARLGEQIIVVRYYYTKMSYKEFTYQVKINAIPLSKPQPAVNESGTLILTPGDNEYMYVESYDITLQGIGIPAEDIRTYNWKQQGAYAEVDIDRIMERNAFPDQEGYILEVTARSGESYVLDSSPASLTFGYYTVSGGALEGLRADWQNSLEGYHQFSLSWTDDRLGEDDYLLELLFSHGDTEARQQRTSTSLTQNGITYYASGTIDWRRWVENQLEPVRMDTLTVTFRAKSTAERIYGYQSGAEGGIIAQYEITVKTTPGQKPELVIKFAEGAVG